MLYTTLDLVESLINIPTFDWPCTLSWQSRILFYMWHYVGQVVNTKCSETVGRLPVMYMCNTLVSANEHLVAAPLIVHF